MIRTPKTKLSVLEHFERKPQHLIIKGSSFYILEGDEYMKKNTNKFDQHYNHTGMGSTRFD